LALFVSWRITVILSQEEEEEEEERSEFFFFIACVIYISHIITFRVILGSIVMCSAHARREGTRSSLSIDIFQINFLFYSSIHFILILRKNFNANHLLLLISPTFVILYLRASPSHHPQVSHLKGLVLKLLVIISEASGQIDSFFDGCTFARVLLDFHLGCPIGWVFGCLRNNPDLLMPMKGRFHQVRDGRGIL
jgi:hypothetical protein